MQPLPAPPQKTATIHVRVTDKERTKLIGEARTAKLRLSAYIRRKLGLDDVSPVSIDDESTNGKRRKAAR